MTAKQGKNINDSGDSINWSAATIPRNISFFYIKETGGKSIKPNANSFYYQLQCDNENSMILV